MATETANTTATRAVVFHPSSSVGFPNPSSSVGFPHPRQRDGGGRNDVGVADLVDGRDDGRRRRECLVFMSQFPNGGGDAQARRPERRDFKRQGFHQPRIARIGAERSAHHAHPSHNIAEKCESSSMRVIIPMIYSTNSVHRVGAGITARVVWGISATGQTRKSGRREVISGLPLRPDIVAVTALVSLGPEADFLRLASDHLVGVRAAGLSHAPWHKAADPYVIVRVLLL